MTPSNATVENPVFIGADISGYSKALRDLLFSKIDKVDEYTWYVSLGGEETETGDHYILIRGGSYKEIWEVFLEIEDHEDYFKPTFYEVDPDQVPKHGGITCRERFKIKDSGKNS